MSRGLDRTLWVFSRMRWDRVVYGHNELRPLPLSASSTIPSCVRAASSADQVQSFLFVSLFKTYEKDIIAFIIQMFIRLVCVRRGSCRLLYVQSMEVAYLPHLPLSYKLFSAIPYAHYCFNIYDTLGLFLYQPVKACTKPVGFHAHGNITLPIDRLGAVLTIRIYDVELSSNAQVHKLQTHPWGRSTGAWDTFQLRCLIHWRNRKESTEISLFVGSSSLG